MTRIDEDMLTHHFEVALAIASPPLLEALVYRRQNAIADMARHLAERMRGFDIRSDEPGMGVTDQLLLFPEDFGPIG